MSQVLTNKYLGELDRLKKVGGTHRESVVREAFKDLLKGWGKQHDLVFIPDHKERVIDLLARVTTVSVETMRIVEAIRSGPR